jgi:DNA-binding CsgD family transcriptional regulator
VLHSIGLGCGTRQISGKLNRSIKTIESPRASLQDKLKLDSRSDLLRLPVRWRGDRSSEQPSGPGRPDPPAADGE